MDQPPTPSRPDPPGSTTTAIGRDPDAFEAFYRRHVREVERFVARRVHDPQVAADLTADIFLALIERADTYDANRGTPIAWLFGIARTVVLDHGRRSARHLNAMSRVVGRALLDADDHARLEDRLAAEADARRTLAAMADLPDADRAVLELVALAGLSLTAAASALGVKPGTARVRLHRARRRLAGIIAPDAPTRPLTHPLQPEEALS